MSFLIDILKSVLVGIVHGIASWLPLSASGHLNLMNQILFPAGYPEGFADLFLPVLNLCSLIAAVLLFGNRILPFGKQGNRSRRVSPWRLPAILIAAALPSVLLQILLGGIVSRWCSSAAVTAGCLIVFGLFLLAADGAEETKYNSLNAVPFVPALLAGCAGALGMIPGVSRIGAVMTAGMLLGFSRSTAAEFAVCLMIPVRLVTSIIMLAGAHSALDFKTFLMLWAAAAASLLISFAVIRTFVQYCQDHDIRLFAVCRVLVGIAAIAMIILRVLPSGFGV